MRRKQPVAAKAAAGFFHSWQMPDKEKTMDRSMVTVSKFLSKHLRHTPEELGLTLQPGGWVSVDDLLAASERAGFKITYDER